MGDRGIQGRRITELLELVYQPQDFYRARLTDFLSILKKRQEETGREDVDMTDVLDGFSHKARDHARVPMQVRLVRCQSILLISLSVGLLT